MTSSLRECARLLLQAAEAHGRVPPRMTAEARDPGSARDGNGNRLDRRDFGGLQELSHAASSSRCVAARVDGPYSTGLLPQSSPRNLRCALRIALRFALRSARRTI